MTQQKTVLITGATSGIGRQLALDYCEQGWRVIAIGRNSERLNALTLAGVNALQLDLAEDNATSRLAEYLEQQSVALDVAILNAGVCEYVDVAAIDPAMFRRVFTGNVFTMTNALSPVIHALKRSSSPVLALMGSTASYFPFTKAEAYGASKAAISYLSDSLRVDLKAYGIHVSLISPGFVDTPLTQKNTFAMPMMVTSEVASDVIRREIEAKKTRIHFPKGFARLLQLLGNLPSACRVWIGEKLA